MPRFYRFRFRYESKLLENNPLQIEKFGKDLQKRQQDVLQKLSELLPESSQETNICEEDCEKLGVEDFENILKESCSGESLDIKKKRRPRRKAAQKRKSTRIRKNNLNEVIEKVRNATISSPKKRKWVRSQSEDTKKMKPSTHDEDSGFGTPSEHTTVYKLRDHQPIEPNNGSQDSFTSTQSVSLLQNADVMGTTIGNDTGVTLAWNIKLFPALEDEEKSAMEDSVNKAVQTENVFFASKEDKQFKRNVDFVLSVLRLRKVLQSRTNVTSKKLSDILSNLNDSGIAIVEESTDESDDEDEVLRLDSPDHFDFKKKKTVKSEITVVKNSPAKVSKETVRYVAKASSTEAVMEMSAEALLAFFTEEISENLVNLCSYWKNSVKEDAVAALNAAVDSGVIGIRRRVSHFLQEMADDLYKPFTKAEKLSKCAKPTLMQDLILELKTSFLCNFCQSVNVQYDLIVHLQSMLGLFNRKNLEEVSSVKSLYFSLRLLRQLLGSFLQHLNHDGIRELTEVKVRETNSGVLDMWKENWKRVGMDDNNSVHKNYLMVASEWLQRTDNVLRFCAEDAPLLSAIAQKCSSLLLEILTIFREILAQNE